MPILVLLLDSIIVGVFFLSLFVLPSVLRGLFRNKEEYNTVWKRFFNEGRPFTIGGAILFIWGLLGVIGVLLNYSFDKQHGIPTYYTDATLIYSYLPSLITATIGLISWTYFKSLRKKKQEAVVAEPIEEDIPKKASHVVSVKVRKSPDNPTISEPIPPVASKAPTANAKTRYCKYCGAQIDPSTKQCSSCGKQYFNFSKTKIIIPLVCVALIVGACVGYFAYNNARDKQLLSNAMAALENQQFSVALSYFNELPSASTKYPGELAYAKAGILLENDDLISALKAFENISNFEVPEKVLFDLENEIYLTGIDYYRKNELSEAKRHFYAVEEYKLSSSYLFLANCKTNAYTSSINYEKLIDLIGFEDVNEIILKHQDTFGRFLTDRWVSVKDNYYFEITGEGKAYYNLPHNTSGKYYTLSNGIYSIGDYIAPNDSNGKTFKFTIISENRIKVYCFKNKSTYELYREGSEDLNRAMLVASVLS